MQKTYNELQEALAASPGFKLKIIGHSLGGGTAAIATMMYALCSHVLPAEPALVAMQCILILCP